MSCLIQVCVGVSGVRFRLGIRRVVGFGTDSPWKCSQYQTDGEILFEFWVILCGVRDWLLLSPFQFRVFYDSHRNYLVIFWKFKETPLSFQCHRGQKESSIGLV